MVIGDGDFIPMEIPVSKPSYYVIQAMSKRLNLPAENIAAEFISTCIAIVGCDADYLNSDDLRGKIQDGLSNEKKGRYHGQAAE